eukprot:COSAG01_NODE_6704_length_3536_cov_7.500145_4_plen_184_part_00
MSRLFLSRNIERGNGAAGVVVGVNSVSVQVDEVVCSSVPAQPHSLRSAGHHAYLSPAPPPRDRFLASTVCAQGQVEKVPSLAELEKEFNVKGGVEKEFRLRTARGAAAGIVDLKLRFEERWKLEDILVGGGLHFVSRLCARPVWLRCVCTRSIWSCHKEGTGGAHRRRTTTATSSKRAWSTRC